MKTTFCNSCQYMCKDTPCAKDMVNAVSERPISLWAKCHVSNEKKYHMNVCSFYVSIIVSLIYHACTFIIPFTFTDSYHSQTSRYIF